MQRLLKMSGMSSQMLSMKDFKFHVEDEVEKKRLSFSAFSSYLKLIKDDSLIKAVVPVRKGSTRVPNKSIRNFCGTTLLDLKIKTLKKVLDPSNIVVATNCNTSIEIARKNEVSFVRRDEKYCSSECSPSDYFENLAEIAKTVFFIYAPPTTPFIKPKTYVDFIDKMVSSDTYDSVSLANTVNSFAYFKGKPLNYDPKHSVNSQDLEPVNLIDYGLVVTTSDSIKKTKDLIGENPLFLGLGLIEGWDINYMDEFKIAELIFKENNVL